MCSLFVQFSKIIEDKKIDLTKKFSKCKVHINVTGFFTYYRTSIFLIYNCVFIIIIFKETNKKKAHQSHLN